MIDHTKAKSNRELLEAATSFLFSEIEIKIVKVPGAEWVEIRKSGKICDRKTGMFVGLVNKYAVINGHILDIANTRFKDVYEAYGKVQELLK